MFSSAPQIRKETRGENEPKQARTERALWLDRAPPADSGNRASGSLSGDGSRRAGDPFAFGPTGSRGETLATHHQEPGIRAENLPRRRMVRKRRFLSGDRTFYD